MVGLDVSEKTMSIGAGVLNRRETRQTPTNQDADRNFRKALECAAVGEFTEAIETLHYVTKSCPDHLQAWTAKAMLYRLVGNKKMADLCAETASHLIKTR